MPADVTASGLHLAQSLPLMKPIMLYADLSVTLAASQQQIFIIGTFTMPFYGNMLYQGTLNMRTNSAGLQAPDPVGISAASVPAPTDSSPSTWRTEGGSGYAEASVPLVGWWTGVAAGTPVTVRASVTNGSTAITTTVFRASGVMFCTKT